MDAAKLASGNESAQESASLAFVQGKERPKDRFLQQQRNDMPVIQARSGNTGSLLSAASAPADRALASDGQGGTTSLNTTFPVTTTTTNSTIHPTTTTTTNTTTTTTSTMTPAASISKAAASQARVAFLHIGDDGSSPVWDHYCECAMLLHGISHRDTCGSELVRQVVRIPSTADSHVLDDDFVDGFVALIEKKFATEEGMQALNQEMDSWWDYQKRTTAKEGEKLAVWISLFGCALRVAKTLREDGRSAGALVPATHFAKLRTVIDNRRKELVRIHFGDQQRNITSPAMKPGNAPTQASVQENAPATPHKRRRAGSMTALFTVVSPGGDRKALPALPKEQLASFESKAKALLGWKKKADRTFEKYHVDQSVLRLFEQCFADQHHGLSDIYCIAYKFLALVRFAELARGSVIRDALVEEIDNELGYVNEILLFREKLKSLVRPDSDASPEERGYYSLWLDFFQQVGILMDFRRSNRETALSESPEMTSVLTRCEIAYGNVVSKMRDAAELRQKQDGDAQARRKADRAKERRLKGRSMDFLMPGKERRAADPSATRDIDAIGLSPRKKIAEQDRQRDDAPDDRLMTRTEGGVSGSVPLLQDRKANRKNLPVAESLPNNAVSASGQPISPASGSGKKKKPATLEMRQQEAGPVRAGEKKKAKPKAIRHEQETNAEARDVGAGDTPGKVGREKKAGKEEKTEKKPGKATKGAKDD